MKELPDKLLGEIARRLVSALDPEAIYLFGSHAVGTADRHSDIDLVVVVKEGAGANRELARRGRRSLWGLAAPVDLIVCTTAEMAKWSGLHCNLLHTVAEKGRLIYAA